MVAWADSETRRRIEDARALEALATETLRDVIARERENGRAFGPAAERCRLELARRGEQA